jgi:hypothetical protein
MRFNTGTLGALYHVCRQRDLIRVTSRGRSETILHTMIRNRARTRRNDDSIPLEPWNLCRSSCSVNKLRFSSSSFLSSAVRALAAHDGSSLLPAVDDSQLLHTYVQYARIRVGT